MSLARLSKLVLRAGARPDSAPRTLELSQVTVFVGPNNGGKSSALGDLARYAERGSGTPIPTWEGGTVISEIELDVPASQDEVMAFLNPRIEREEANYVHVRTFAIDAPGGPFPASGSHALQREQIDPTSDSPENVAVRLLRISSVALNGRQRFELAEPKQMTSLGEPPTNHWMAVERSDEIFAEVDQMIFEAFDRHLVMQTFQPPNITPALQDVPLTPEERQSTNQEAVAAQMRASPLQEFSDGVQVFCGLTAALAAIPHILLLIDEPEAFLHPTLARKLGANLARIARERDARLFAATHSAEFLLGCLEEVPTTTVARLDYRGGVAASHVLSPEEMAGLSRRPLLRSANALRALFARSAVVCEADSDRAFYEEINRRLLAEDGRQGAPDTVFVNAQNWQTTADIARPLREAGVPTAIVLDLETLAKDGPWPDFVQLASLADEDRNRILDFRSKARDAILRRGAPDADGPLYVKHQGIGALDGDDRAKVQVAMDEFAGIGIFLVDVGELENWLSQFGLTNKRTWVTDMLNHLGAPSDAAYVAPGTGDVWAFIERMASWLEDPNRAGMPDR